MKTSSVWSVFVLLLIIGCSNSGSKSLNQPENMSAQELLDNYEIRQEFGMTINVISSGIDSTNGRLLQDHTCEGEGTSPSLQWENVPSQTKSLALVFEDPASDELGGEGLWVHWVLHSIPPDINRLSSGIGTEGALDIGARHGVNDYDEFKYTGPCPNPTVVFTGGTANFKAPIAAEERPYYFKLFALDREIQVPLDTNRDFLLEAIDGYIIAGGVLETPYRSRRKESRRTVSD